MLKTYRSQIFFTLIVFVLTLFAVTAAVTINVVEQNQIATIRNALIREAETIAILLSRQANASPSEIAEMLQETSGSRVTLIDNDGTVLSDSASNASSMDNHGQRPEIKEARTKAYGSAIRTSTTTGENMLYVAITIKSDEQVTGFIRLANSLDEVQATTNEIIRYLLIMLLVLFLISAFVSWRIARSLSQPVQGLRRIAEQISAGNYTNRVTYLKENEIGRLGHAINEMSDSLQEQMEQIMDSENRLRNVLDHLLVGVILTDYEGNILLYNPFLERYSKAAGQGTRSLSGVKLSELHLPVEFIQQWQEALSARAEVQCELRTYFPDELILDVHFIPIGSGMMVTLHDLTSIRRLENMRSEFVANVSHELRTPLAAIRGFAETLKMGALTDREAAESFTQIIIDESDRLNRLVNDLLELSKIETKRLPLMVENVHVSQLVDEIHGLLDQEMTRKQMKFESSGPQSATVEGDYDRLRQILINLVHNAIQYTPEGGLISVRWEVTSDYIQLAVRDNGKGIPAMDLPHVFERFFRVDRARNRNSGGTGLGLSITKHLVELHGGSIEVDSVLGDGSCFTIILPLQQN
jgi:two-component system phosphate regulon sensor histidine kinase PhoR